MFTDCLISRHYLTLFVVYNYMMVAVMYATTVPYVLC